MKLGTDLWIATGVNQLACGDQFPQLIDGGYEGNKPYHKEMP